jgi:glyoxylase-like metal-dependent hydrolase (beta-lactamase superfamily II)
LPDLIKLLPRAQNYAAKTMTDHQSSNSSSSMTSPTRREMLARAAGAVGGAAIGSLAPTIQHVSAETAKQMSGSYRYEVGEFEIVAILDGHLTLPIKPFITNATPDQINAALEAAHLPKDKATLPFIPIVLKTGTRHILVDTGFGQHAGPTLGFLPANMKAAGIDPKSIDIVLISHFHPDHISGLRDADGNLAFPNAEIMVPKRDWAYWIDQGNMTKLTEKLPEGITKGHFRVANHIFDGLAGSVTKYDWDSEVAPGVTATEAKGDTPGHTAFVVASRNARLLVQGDLANQPDLFLRHPDWHNIFENDPDTAQATRRRIYNMVAAEKILVAGYHFPFPGVGYVENDGSAYRFLPTS